MDHPPCCLSLVPSDFHLLDPLKKHMVGKIFKRRRREASCHLLTTLSTALFYAGGKKCLNSKVWRVPCVIRGISVSNSLLPCYTEVLCISVAENVSICLVTGVAVTEGRIVLPVYCCITVFWRTFCSDYPSRSTWRISWRIVQIFPSYSCSFVSKHC